MLPASDILHLEHLHAQAVHNEGDYYRIETSGDVVPTACPACSSALYRHGTQRQSFMDTPMHGKRVLLDIERRRYRCRSCGKTLFDPLPDMDGKRFMTTRLVRHIERQCLTKTFAALSRDIGVDNKTIRLIFDDYVDHLKATVTFETPHILGIDELMIIGQYRAMITNVEKLSLFDMLPTRNEADLLAYFQAMPDKHKVEVVMMDMWSVYRQVVQEQFPGRMIVADRSHIVRMANDALERVRKAIRKTLPDKTRLKLKYDRKLLFLRSLELDDADRAKVNQWSAQFPLLGDAYKLKELFHSLYEQPDKQSAMNAADAWANSIPSELEPYFKDAKGALQSWRAEIFSYYDVSITNAYTESINNIAKEMNRMGRGYSLDVIRARLLYNDEAQKDTRQTIRKKPRKKAETAGTEWSFFQTLQTEPVEAEQVIEYGPSLATLARLLREGYFA
ncbi:ISL3 family transposase [Ferrovum sp.]|uniref:ISL3 family transposase n=1 Tax=Ferrovum sp. TaxID=2609467 RepID=UPI002635EAC1|nr:ISL3 family transposase [Ferrovum sp.]